MKLQSPISSLTKFSNEEKKLQSPTSSNLTHLKLVTFLKHDLFSSINFGHKVSACIVISFFQFKPQLQALRTESKLDNDIRF